MDIRGIGRALAYRNFRLFFVGQTVSLIGSWMQQVAMSWLVFELTGSSLLLGVVLFLNQIPCLFLPPVTGIYVDRWNRHKVLIATQILAMLQALILAGLTLTHVVAVWHIMALSLLMGFIISFDMPARHAFTVEMVPDRKILANAVPLSAVMFNGARLIGPAVGGFVLAATSTGMCFLINAISFLAVLLSLAMMDKPAGGFSHGGGSAAHPVKAGIGEGLHYVWDFFPFRAILVVLAVGGITGSAISVILPELTVHVLKGDASLLGWLMSSLGFGALVAGLFLAARQSVLGLGQWIGAGVMMMGAGMIGIPFITYLPVSFFLMFVSGFGMVVHISAANTILQTLSDEDKRGRVMSLYTMGILGFVPIGSLISGGLTELFSVAGAMVIMGSLAVLGGIVFWFALPKITQQMEPVLMRLRILPAAPVEITEI